MGRIGTEPIKCCGLVPRRAGAVVLTIGLPPSGAIAGGLSDESDFNPDRLRAGELRAER